MTIRSSQMEPGLLQRDVSPSIRLLLETAMKSYQDKLSAETLLKQAFEMDPSVLDTYVVFYKFYFYHKLISKAEEWVYLALNSASKQGGFDNDWRKLNNDSALWDHLDSPERIYLYSLKALSFLRLKQGDFETPREVLNKLEVLDPQDQVGWTVIAQMHARLSSDE